LGIARVGDATGADDFIVAPEVIGGQPMRHDGREARYVEDFRASDGRIKRQAVRFRIYARLTDGSVTEITANDGRIDWHVAIANLKGGWYDFNQAMDLPAPLSKPATRRNASASVPRADLDIVPTPQSISGRDQGAIAFDDGKFWNKAVYLGELRTDGAGRLLFLGGRGRSAPFEADYKLTTFANNAGWHDDIADGPVRATVTFPNGRSIEAEPAYVAVTPPNYAPGLRGVVTLDDAMREVFTKAGWLTVPAATSFANDVWPVFDRLTGLQWVDHGLFMIHGDGSPLDARNPEVIKRLRDAAITNAPYRQAIFELFRDPAAPPGVQPATLPQIFGDGYGESPDNSFVLLSVTPGQYEHLRRWAAGQFSDDWSGLPMPPDFHQLSARDQLAHLERAALDDCLGGPFHPGIELTWVMRLPLVWKRPYRLNILPGDGPARQDFGDELTPAVCVGQGGPFDGIAAGALTRFMGVPWQADGASCNSDADYAPWSFLSMPTFWGARVPDQVFPQANYNRTLALDPTILAAQMQKHFTLRADWLRDVRGYTYLDRIHLMVRAWAGLGMVLPVRTVPGPLPADTRVEQGRSQAAAGSDPKIALVEAIEALASQAATFRTSGLTPPAPPAVHGRDPLRQGEV
jgi:hypothetical protein